MEVSQSRPDDRDRGTGESSGSRPTREERGLSLPAVTVVPEREGVEVGRISQREVPQHLDWQLATIERANHSTIPMTGTSFLLSMARQKNTQLLHPTSPMGPCHQAAMAESLMLIYDTIDQRIRCAQRRDAFGRPVVEGITWGSPDDPLGATIFAINPFGAHDMWEAILREESRRCESRRQDVSLRERRLPRRSTPAEGGTSPGGAPFDQPEPPRPNPREEYRRDRGYLCFRLESERERIQLAELANEGTFARWFLNNINICNATPNLPDTRNHQTFTTATLGDLQALQTLLQSGQRFNTSESTDYLSYQRDRFGRTVHSWYLQFSSPGTAPAQGEHRYSFMRSPEWRSFCQFIEHYRPDLYCTTDMRTTVQRIQYLGRIRPPRCGLLGLNQCFADFASRSMWQEPLPYRVLTLGE